MKKTLKLALLVLCGMMVVGAYAASDKNDLLNQFINDNKDKAKGKSATVVKPVPKAASTGPIVKNLPSWAGDQGALFKGLPNTIYTHKKYLFYLVGDAGEGMTSDNYTDITGKLVELGFLVISRPKRNRGYSSRYINRVVAQINKLLKAHVPSKNITVVGYSYGGMAALRVSTLVDNPGINYVIVAGCPRVSGKVVFPNYGKIDPVGMIWNIYDKNDKNFGSLNEYMKFNDKKVRAFCQEREVNSGKGHAVGCTPDDTWLKPLVRIAGQR